MLCGLDLPVCLFVSCGFNLFETCSCCVGATFVGFDCSDGKGLSLVVLWGGYGWRFRA